MEVFNVENDITIAIDTIPSNGNLTARQREKEAETRLLKSLFGNVELRHNDAGKPSIDGYNISISHTVNRNGGYIAVIFSKDKEVGIDIEYVSNRIMKIASRFLRNDEHPITVEDHLVFWCAKEAMYKLFSSDDLTYQQMYVSPSMDYILNVKRDLSVPVKREITSDFVLTWLVIK